MKRRIASFKERARRVSEKKKKLLKEIREEQRNETK